MKSELSNRINPVLLNILRVIYRVSAAGSLHPARPPAKGSDMLTYYPVLAITPTSDAWIPDYRPHLAAQTQGSNSIHFLIEGKDDLA